MKAFNLGWISSIACSDASTRATAVWSMSHRRAGAVVYAWLVAPPRRISREDVLAKVAAVFAGEAAPSMDEMAMAAGVSRAALYA